MRTKSLLSRSALLIAFLLIIACFSILFIISSDESVAYASAEDALTTSSISTYQSRVNRSVALYDNIIKSYTINKIRSNDRDITEYSNDFADVACKNVSVLNSYSADIAKKKLSGKISKSNAHVTRLFEKLSMQD